MLKAFARKSAKLTLNHFVNFYNGGECNQDRIRTFLALFFRELIKSSATLTGQITEPSELSIAISRLQLTMSKQEAFSISQDMQRQAKSFKTGQFYQEDKNSMLFIGSYFHIFSESPEPRKAIEMQLDGKSDKNYELLTQFEKVLTQIFTGYEEFLLTDVAVDSFVNFKNSQR